jgi:hypothetical protein
MNTSTPQSHCVNLKVFVAHGKYTSMSSRSLSMSCVRISKSWCRANYHLGISSNDQNSRADPWSATDGRSSILAYSNDPGHLYCSCRRVSHALKTGVKVYPITHYLLRRTRISYLDMSAPNGRWSCCSCARFLKCSTDRRLAYFDISPVQWSPSMLRN